VAVVEITPVRGAAGARPASRATSLIGSWVGGLSVLALVIWLIPIKRYTFPVALPFRLEPYRLTILLLLAALVVSALAGRARISAAGHGKPVFFLAVAALGAQLANLGKISAGGLETQSLKSLSYFISFLIAFTIVCSTLRYRHEIDIVVRVIVVGGAVVAVAALVESGTRYNVFNHLQEWIPVLRATGEDKYNFRGGRLRVRASAQHPIALASVLLLTLPLAAYAAKEATTRVRSRFWLGCGVLLTAAAIATVSRTAVVMLVAITVTALVFRPRQVLRHWPVLLVLLAATHFAAPGAVRHLYKAFTPKQGLISEQSVRSGERGSGRVADIAPGIRRWAKAPILGRGLGTVDVTGEPTGEPTVLQTSIEPAVIYDDQYLNTLVSLGVVGFVGVVWFVWGAVGKLARAARRTTGSVSDLLVACTASAAGFATSMLTYDAFAFVQASLLFFVICGLGLVARRLATA
jgi:polysaccharide biosynthesis protein PslJ